MNENEASDFCKALGHPIRMRIVSFLIHHPACMCGPIVEHLPIAQSTTSQHLKVLKESGIIQGTIEGASTCYCLNTEHIKEGISFLTSLFHEELS